MKKVNNINKPFMVILGIVQDGGFPHAGCKKNCCKAAWRNAFLRKNVTNIAIIDPKTRQRWLIDATPDFKHQLNKLDNIFPLQNQPPNLNGIFLTHGHIGHFTGLINLEKAVMNATNTNVFAMPKMHKLLNTNQPWKNMIEKGNIKLKSLQNRISVNLNKRISVLPFLVPHRSEFSETIGFVINGPNKKILFIPDIDGWSQFNEIEKLVNDTDLAFLDGTFFDRKELPNRDISQVPHPFIKQSILRFQKFPLKEKQKIFFIHLNHTNPALFPLSREYKLIIKKGFNVARENQIVTI